MTSVNQAMLLIKSLDSWASLRLSEYTGKWYVEALIEVSDGYVLTGGTEHADTPSDAVFQYLNYLKAIPRDNVIVTNVAGGEAGRRHWKWNGAAFAEEPVQFLKERVGGGQETNEGESNG